MFGLQSCEKMVGDILAGEYLVLGGIKLLYAKEVTEVGGLLQLITDSGNFLFTRTDKLSVV